MRLTTIHIENYRCFNKLDVTFGEHITLLVGKNGVGKSAILDAIAVAVSTFLYGFGGGTGRRILKEDAKYNFYEIEGTIDAQHQFPVIIEAEGTCNGESNVRWTRALNAPDGNTTVKNAYRLINFAKQMQSQVMAGDRDTTLPVISYYGTGRLRTRKKERRGLQTLQKFNRQMGYTDCMNAEPNEKLMADWFERMTLKCLQNQQKSGKREKMPQLAVVEEAICTCFRKINGCKDVTMMFELDTRRIMMEYTDDTGQHCRLALNELSDGYKNTLSMIGDIAYRMAVLNPQLGTDILKKTPGIVLIDEIDLHLHPEWQRTILEDLQSIFPQVQFVATSHAPAVIGSVKKEDVRILGGGQAVIPAQQTYGRDANSIFREIMKVEERPKEVGQLLSEFYQSIDNGDLERAETLLSKIEDIVGYTDPEINGARVTLDFERMGEEFE